MQEEKAETTYDFNITDGSELVSIACPLCGSILLATGLEFVAFEHISSNPRVKRIDASCKYCLTTITIMPNIDVGIPLRIERFARDAGFRISRPNRTSK